MAEKENFATVGTESFKLSGVEQSKKVVINIQEEKSEGVILDDKAAKKLKITGNPLLDWYNHINEKLVEHSKIKIQSKANFFHLLAVMINAGIPMVRALRSLEAQEASQRLKGIIEKMAESIEGGESLSEAMMEFPDVFTEQEIGMTESGEASGQISRVLNNLADDTEKAYMIKSKIKSAMMYPMIVFLLLIGVVTAMMVFVIPKLTDLFASSGNELPLITKIVVAISNFMINEKWLLMTIILAIGFLFSIFRKTDFGRYAIDKFKISMPIFGPLFKKAYLSRFARSLSNLLDSNISIIKAMEITANSIGNEVYRKRLLLAMEDIKQGIPLAESLAESVLFPPMLINMIDVGEKTAQIDEIAGKVSQFYENELDNTIAGISKIIEPVVLVIIGVSVGTIVAAIMLPIMKLADFASVV